VAGAVLGGISLVAAQWVRAPCETC